MADKGETQDRRKRLRVGRRTERAVVNAVRALLEDHDYVVERSPDATTTTCGCRRRNGPRGRYVRSPIGRIAPAEPDELAVLEAALRGSRIRLLAALVGRERANAGV